MLTRYLDLLQHARLTYVALALGAYIVSVPLMAFRWQTVLRGLRAGLPRIGLRPLVLASLAASFVNNVTPAARLSGEACRVVALARLRLASIGQATASVAYERLTEIPVVAVLGAIAVSLFGRMAPRWLLPAIVLVLVIASFARGTIARAVASLRERWVGLENIAVHRSSLVASMGISGGIWLLDVARLRFVAAAFGAHVDFVRAAALAGVALVAGWVPTVGGLGAIEGGLVAGMVAFGVPVAQAVAIAAVERAISYGLATLAGFGALSLLGGRSLWSAVRARARAEEAIA